MPDQLAAENISLNTELERFEEERFVEWSTTGNGYFIEQTTKVFPSLFAPLVELA